MQHFSTAGAGNMPPSVPYFTPSFHPPAPSAATAPFATPSTVAALPPYLHQTNNLLRLDHHVPHEPVALNQAQLGAELIVPGSAGPVARLGGSLAAGSSAYASHVHSAGSVMGAGLGLGDAASEDRSAAQTFAEHSLQDESADNRSMEAHQDLQGTNSYPSPAPTRRTSGRARKPSSWSAAAEQSVYLHDVADEQVYAGDPRAGITGGDAQDEVENRSGSGSGLGEDEAEDEDEEYGEDGDDGGEYQLTGTAVHSACGRHTNGGAAGHAEDSLTGSGAEHDEHAPLYVNAKQYHRILKRRQARARLEEMGRLSRERKVSLPLLSTELSLTHTYCHSCTLSTSPISLTYTNLATNTPCDAHAVQVAVSSLLKSVRFSRTVAQ